MKTYDVDTFNKFHTAVQRYNDNTIYRGVSHASYKLLPKLGREKCVNNFNHSGRYKDLFDFEEKIMDEFKKYAPQFLEQKPASEWEWWAMAQHHGLPTRFLDWTKNPLVAAYFAVEDCNDDEDSVVYATDSEQFRSNCDLDSPLEVTEVYLYIPPHINKRIISQNGLFTVHNDVMKPLDETQKPNERIKTRVGEKYIVDKIKISKTCKMEFKKILNLYGVNKSSIYPGLDGIAGYLEWRSLECK